MMHQGEGTQSPGGKGAQEVGGTGSAGAEKEEGDRRPGKGSSLEGRHQQKEREGTRVPAARKHPGPVVHTVGGA